MTKRQRKMKSGKLLFLVAVAVALFAVLQIAESSKSIDDEAKAIRKHVDEEFKKMSKRAADEEDDGGKHKKGKKRKGSATTAAPVDKSTTVAPNGSTTTTKGPNGSTSTTKAADGSTTKAPSGPSTKAPSTGHPDAPSTSTTTGKPGDSPTTKSDMKPAIEKQEAEREIIRAAFKELVKWQEWLHSNSNKTLNPKAAKATWQMAERIKRIIESNIAGRRFHGKLDTTW